MTGKGNQSYIVNENILPEAILKTALAKEMLARGDALTVNEAAEKAGISRSAFYKYRDGIHPYTKDEGEASAAVALILEHRSGVLSNVLHAVASMKGNIDSINQSVPIHGVAIATMTINTTLVEDFALLLEKLQAQEGVKKVDVIAY